MYGKTKKIQTTIQTMYMIGLIVAGKLLIIELFSVANILPCTKAYLTHDVRLNPRWICPTENYSITISLCP